MYGSIGARMFLIEYSSRTIGLCEVAWLSWETDPYLPLLSQDSDILQLAGCCLIANIRSLTVTYLGSMHCSKGPMITVSKISPTKIKLFLAADFA